MKKIFVSPTICVKNMESQQIIAASKIEGGPKIQGGPETGGVITDQNMDNFTADARENNLTLEF